MRILVAVFVIGALSAAPAGATPHGASGVGSDVAQAQAAALDTALCVTNGPVRAVVREGNTVYIGGEFTQVATRTGGGAPLGAASGELVTPFSRVRGSVSAVVADGVGGWYIGGTFTAVGEAPRANLAHILADGSVADWDPGANGTVRALTLSGGTLYAGGHFTAVGGLARNRIAALDAATGAATPWDPNADGAVLALAVSGGAVYAGGEFTSIGGQARGRIASLDAVTGLTTAWNPDANAPVLALAVNGSRIAAGGLFTSMGGQTAEHLAELDVATGAVTNGAANGPVLALAASANGLCVGGRFTQLGGFCCLNNIAILGLLEDPRRHPSALGSVLSLAVSGGVLYAGGDFGAMDGQPRNRLAALDIYTGRVTEWNPGADASVNVLAASGSTVYAGGSFSTVGAWSRNRIAALDATTGVASTWNPNADAPVSALAVSNGVVYAGGEFASIGGQPRGRIAAMDVATGLATGWNPGANGPVHALALGGGAVYAGGQFTGIGGQPRGHLAALDAASGMATSWNPSANASVRTLTTNGSTVYAGGDFTTIAGQPRSYLAALDAATGAATAWDPGADDYVYALALDGGRVYAGGHFTAIGGHVRYHIAALDAATGAAQAWDPNPNLYGYVYALAASGGTVYAGGTFTRIGGQLRNRIAALRTSTGFATAWDPDANGQVNALAVHGGTVYAAGSFTRIAGRPQVGLVSLTADAPPTTAQPVFAAEIALSSEIVAPGQSVTITASVRNDGLASDDGRIVISLPALTDPLDAGRVSSGSGGDAPGYRVIPAGSSLLDRACQSVTASYLVAEYADADWQPLGEESNTFTLTVQPRQAGLFHVDVRGTMLTAGAGPCDYVSDVPPNGEAGFTDQQGWPVRRFSVLVLSAPSTMSWRLIGPAGSGPGARSAQSAVYDTRRDELVLYGGTALTYFGDTWALPLAEGVSWAPIQPGGPVPLPRILHSMVHNPVNDHLLIFGGYYDSFLNDLWVLARTPVAWWFPIAVPGTRPSPRIGHAALYDPVRNRMLVIGGFDGAVKNDVWEYAPLVNGAWRQLQPAGEPMPPRASHSAIYDPQRDRVLVFGGDAGTFLNDVWELRLSGTPAWSRIEPAGPPPSGRREHTAVYYALWDEMVVFGGFDGARRNDVWTLSLIGSPAWEQRYTTTVRPSGRHLHSAIYDPVRTRMVVFGGQVGSTSYSNEVWELSLDPPVPTAVAISLAEAVAELEGVRLSWYGEGAGNLTARVERRTEASEWVARGAPEARDRDHLAFTDREVAPGTRYGYRLVVREAGSEVALEPAWLTVPGRAVLALAGASPNPAAGELCVAFSLPAPEPATLELYDLGGRLVSRREVGSLGAGSHRVRLAERAALAAGVYLVRLVGRERSLTAKACVIR